MVNRHDDETYEIGGGWDGTNDVHVRKRSLNVYTPEGRIAGCDGWVLTESIW